MTMMRAAGLLLAVFLWIAPAAAQEATWPHTITGPQGSVTVFQPQAISWPDQRVLTARAAVSVAAAGAAAPILGTIEVTGDTSVDPAARTVTVSGLKLISAKFPSLDPAQAEQLSAKIAAALPNLPPKLVALDTVLLSLKEAPPAPKNVALNNNPPVIFHSIAPASLVVFDGEPVMAPVGGTGLSYAVNTNWDVLHAAGGAWYLLNNGAWMAAPDYKGPYAPAPALPPAFKAIPADPNFADIRKNIPGRTLPPGQVPKVFVSTKPAEIIVTSGPPIFGAIAGTSLQYVKNANADLFLDTGSGRFYYLVSGRWFSAPGLDGPFVFATPDLPADFAHIPPDSAMGHVLVSVPGTPQANAAVQEASIPKTGTLKRDAAKLDVAYAGAPDFKPIPGTSLTYAVNTTSSVIGADGRYYAAYQGAWFVAPSPTGPWVLAESVPPAIYEIPPSSPLYNVTYLQVVSATPAAVTYSYTAGYVMGFVTAGVLAYGTGYYYPPVIVPGRVPGYLPYPYSYAGGVYYNPATGGWARGGTVYGPYGGAAKAGAYYNPNTGTYARGGAVYGPNGGAGAWSAYNPTTGTYAHGSAAWGPDGGTAHASFDNPRYGVSGSTTQNANPYARWGSSTVSTPTKTVDTASASNARGAAGAFSSSTGAQGAAVHGNNGNNAAVVKGQGGDVYAGADGNVYKHTDDGWSKYDNGSWNQVQKPTNTTATQANRTQPTQRPTTAPARQTMNQGNYNQLEQDRQARYQGAQNFNRGAAAPREGAYRGGGGFRR